MVPLLIDFKFEMFISRKYCMCIVHRFGSVFVYLPPLVFVCTNSFVQNNSSDIHQAH